MSREIEKMKTDHKVLIDDEGTTYLWSSGDFHTKEGMLKEAEIKKKKELMMVRGKKYTCFAASFMDRFQTLKRGPAVILPKEAGFIIATTGIHPKSRVVEAGTGSGFLTAMIAQITPNLTSYERSKEFYEIAQQNLKTLGVKANLKQADITAGIQEKQVDAIILDLEEPIKVLPSAYRALREGGYLVAYLPHISQVQEMVTEAKKAGFYHQLTTEIIQRDWIVDERRLRPKNMGIMHTGFLTFLRKL